MKNDVENDDSGYDAVKEAERWLVAVQRQGLPVIDVQQLEMQAVIAAEAKCLDQIMPALIEARQIIEHVKMPKGKKKRLLHELVHASEHLYGNFERMQMKLYTEE